MTRHLATCRPPDSKRPKEAPPAFHLLVEGRYNKGYWLHLAVPMNAPLSRLDAFLRRIWLECCGHMSGFFLPKREELRMGLQAGRVLQPGMVLTYEYDFGSTTELTLKVLGLREGGVGKGDVELLAQNDDPEVVCEQCGSHPAAQICTECVEGWLCESCAADHECEEEMMLPVVNSPRAGVCGYCG